MRRTITIEELATQHDAEHVSDWVEVTQAMIDNFADLTDDHQFIHVDPERAAATPFGGTIAHGFLTLSLVPQLHARADMPEISGVSMGLNYGSNKLRFIAPVRSGKRVRGRFRTIELIEKRAGQWQHTIAYTVEIEGEDKPAIAAEWIIQYFV